MSLSVILSSSYRRGRRFHKGSKDVNKPIPSIFVRVIVLLAALYTSPKSDKSDLSIDVLNLICLLGLYLSSALPY